MPTERYHYQLLDRDVNHKRLHQFAANPSITTTKYPLWSANTPYMRPSSADHLVITSTSSHDSLVGSGARAVKVLGVNEQGAFDSKVYATDGTNAATTAERWWSVFDVEVVSAGAGGGNGHFTDQVGGTIGDIFVKQVTSSNLLAYIEAGENVSHQAIFQVPSGEFWVVDEIAVGGGKGQTLTFEAHIAKQGLPWIDHLHVEHYRTTNPYTVGFLLEGMDTFVITAVADGGAGIAGHADIQFSRYIDRDG